MSTDKTMDPDNVSMASDEKDINPTMMAIAENLERIFRKWHSENKEQVEPTSLLIRADKDATSMDNIDLIAVVPMRFKTDNDKITMVKVLKGLVAAHCLSHDITHVAYFSEAWVSTMDATHDTTLQTALLAGKMKVRDLEGKQEAIVCTIEARTGEALLAIFPLERTSEGLPIIGARKLHATDSAFGTGGTFSNFFSIANADKPQKKQDKEEEQPKTLH